ncbi:MAG: ribonuclease HII [Candidatus Neomarinimicrobiota bacterium]
MSLIAGVDEAGRGPLAGPVVAAAVILPERLKIKGVRDSKLLSENRREELYEEIVRRAVSLETGIVHEDEIDRTDILAATRTAMRMALGKLNPRPDEALIDGYGLPDQAIRNRGIVMGDKKVHVISAASIVAKVTRDRMMRTYDTAFPEYNFGKHKGYGTEEHLDRLKRHGACPIHRKSFHPVKQFVPTLTYLRKNRILGQWGEKLAARELVHRGYEIVEMNYIAAPFGEIDIIARRDRTLVFVEVKTASQKTFGPPQIRLDGKKLRKLDSAFEVYLGRHEDVSDCRFDLITVFYGKGQPAVRHFEDCLNS